MLIYISGVAVQKFGFVPKSAQKRSQLGNLILLIPEKGHTKAKILILNCENIVFGLRPFI